MWIFPLESSSDSTTNEARMKIFKNKSKQTWHSNLKSFDASRKGSCKNHLLQSVEVDVMMEFSSLVASSRNDKYIYKEKTVKLSMNENSDYRKIIFSVLTSNWIKTSPIFLQQDCMFCIH